jgi:hypothetical protein
VRVGVLGVLVGLYTCISSGITTITLLSLIAVWAIIRGLCEMVTAIQLRRERRNAWALIIGGILSVLFGTVLVANPAADALAMIGVIGAYALVFGLMMIVLAFRVRRLPQRLARSPQACAAAPRVVSMNVERKPVGMPRHMFGYTVHIRCQPPRPRENPPMRAALQLSNYKRHTMTDMRALADQAFSRAAGAPLIAGNSVRVLQDARENYPAWLAAIGAAQRHVHFENYILREDEVGQMFAHALLAKAREGVRVRLIYDWMGGFGKTSRAFWQHVRAGGVEVRCYNPPRLDAPLGWLSRDHRKMLSVDGQIGFVTGLCVGRMWVGVPAEQIEPWRDTGVEVRGPAVADIAHAFAHIWAMLGEPLPAHEVVPRDALAPAGTTALRVVASLPATAGLFRLDQLVAALARKRLWLTDAY